jgi:hypothetical protein
VSGLQRYVAGLGGKLELIARFGSERVTLT